MILDSGALGTLMLIPYIMQLSMLSTADHIEVTQGKILNMQSRIKALTGNDMSDGGIRVNVTAVVSTMNKLYYPLDIKDQARADITRYVAVVPTRAIRNTENVGVLPIDKMSLSELIRFSI
jgi:hypothetical protein